MTVVDTLQDQPEAISQKRAWDAPRVTQLRAGSADFEVGPSDDGVDKS